MTTVVVKIGSFALATEERMTRVAERIAQLQQEGNKVVVVTANMPQQRAQLVAPIKAYFNDASYATQALIKTASAQIASAWLAAVLQAKNIKATALTAQQLGIETDAIYHNARIEDVDVSVINELLAQGEVVIASAQGMHGKQTTYLGKGGAETVAIALAAKLQAKEVIIYSTVDGVYTADPSVVPEAKKLYALSYDEMLELAYLGSHILHPRAVELAKKYTVDVYICALMENEQGTWLKEEVDMEKSLLVRGVAFEADIIRLTVGYEEQSDVSLAAIFTTLAEHNINVDIIVQAILNNSNPTVSFSIDKAQFAEALKVLEDSKVTLGFSFADFEVGLAKVSIVGSAMVSNPGVAARMFDRLRQEDIAVKMVSTSEIKVSVVVPQDDMIRAAQALHDEFKLQQ